MQEQMLTQGPIVSDDQARAITEAQMARTARLYGFGGQNAPTTALAQTAPPRPIAPGPMYPMVPDDDLRPPQLTVLAPPDHLLLTPCAHDSQVRLVRMRGAEKVGSWTIRADTANAVASILASFGITLTDLRENEEE